MPKLHPFIVFESFDQIIKVATFIILESCNRWFFSNVTKSVIVESFEDSTELARFVGLENLE